MTNYWHEVLGNVLKDQDNVLDLIMTHFSPGKNISIGPISIISDKVVENLGLSPVYKHIVRVCVEESVQFRLQTKVVQKDWPAFVVLEWFLWMGIHDNYDVKCSNYIQLLTSWQKLSRLRWQR